STFSSELRSHTDRYYRDGPSISIEGRINDELVIGRQLPRAERNSIIALHNRLDAGMRQLTIADEDSESARLQVPAMCIRDGIEHRRNPEDVIATIPAGSSDRHSR